MAGDVLGLEVLDQWVEPGVFRNDKERSARGLGGEAADVVGDVEIEGVAAGALDADVFGIRPEGLKLGGEVKWDFGLVGSAKDLGLEGASAQRSQVLGLNVLEVDKDDARFQLAGDRFGADGTPGPVW